MATKKSKTERRGVSHGKCEAAGRIVLVGTYKGDQLTKWRGWYNYPISDEELSRAEAQRRRENELVTNCDKSWFSKINELWLFNGKKEQRNYKAQFVGIKTRKELIDDFGYPAKGKAHGDKYLLFKTDFKYQHKGDVPEDAERVIIRTADFATAPKVRRELKAYLESSDRKDPDLAKRLPTILTKLRPEQLRVCEAAVQLKFFSILYPVSTPASGKRNVISMFSGAMGLDNGIEKAGLDIRLCVEIQHAMAETIRANRPNIPLIEDDVRNYSGDDMRRIAGLGQNEEVFLVCGGPPCQAFSTAGKRLGFDDERGNVFLKYIDLIGEIRPKYFLLENVRGLLSASYAPSPRGNESRITANAKPFKGSALLYALERIKAIGYSATFTLYDTANYGVPQRRERVIILGSREGYNIPLIPPTHSESGKNGLKKWRTFRNAVEGLSKCTATPIPGKRLKYFKMIGPGECWRDLPENIQREAMGKSYNLPGGKTGFYRRLAWDEPSPTLVTCPTMPATDLMHPVEDRALSIEEYARIQMFPDKWQFKGSTADVYKQIGNAVPVGMGYAAAKHLLWFDSLPDSQKENLQLVDPSAVYSRYRNTNFEFFNQLHEEMQAAK